MVYSGLEFGEYFELSQDSNCHSIIQAVTPVSRMILTLVQMQFIFLSSKVSMPVIFAFRVKYMSNCILFCHKNFCSLENGNVKVSRNC